MKISKETLEILNNFKTLNRGLVFKEGNIIKTKHQQVMMPIAMAELPEYFPRDFAIAELQGFLSVFNLLDDPELEFTEDSIVMTSGGKTARIRYAQPTMVVHMPYNQEARLPSIDVAFDLTSDNFKSIIKAANSFGTPEIAFISDGSKLKLSTYNSHNTRADSFTIDVGESDKIFTMIIDVNHLQMLIRSYRIELSLRGLIQFTSATESNTLKYWIAASEKSKLS